MDDNQNKNQPNTNASDYQKILDEYAASVKPDITQPPENLPEEKIPADSLKETVSLPPEPKKITAEVPGKTLADDLEEALSQEKPSESDIPPQPSLKNIDTPKIESPIHPSLAANLETEEDSFENPPKPTINIEQTPEPEEKSPEEIKAEINRLLADDSSKSQPSSPSTNTPASNHLFSKIFFIISLILFLGVIAALAYFLFLSPSSKSTSNSTSSSTTPTVTNTQENNSNQSANDGNCQLNGNTYNVGESFKSADGCNTCSCSSAGVIACTEMACNLTPTTTTATRSATTSSVSKDWKTYTDSTYKFSINYPSTWTINTKPSNNQVFSITSPEKIKLPKTYPEYDYLKIYFYKNYQSSLTDGKAIESYLSNKTDFLSFSKTKIANIDGYLGNENGMSSNPYPEYFIVRGNDLFEISSDDQDFSEIEKQIINTLKFN